MPPSRAFWHWWPAVAERKRRLTAVRRRSRTSVLPHTPTGVGCVNRTNLPVAQSDTLNCLICVTAGSATSAIIFLYNVTSGVGASFNATAPPGSSLVGNSAEWVVERLEIDTNTPELARYGNVYFDEARAATAGGALIDAGSGNVIDMVDSGSTISAGLIETPTLVQVRYTGPAY
jgi:Peptidase A4 family